MSERLPIPRELYLQGLRVMLEQASLLPGIEVDFASGLTEGERALYAGLEGSAQSRRISWGLGRRALKRLLARMGLPQDTSSISFPNPRLSLSHCESHAETSPGFFAVAAGCPDASAEGVGVDVELGRTPRLGIGRHFLNDSELSWLDSIPPERQPDEILRLWTVKEACFKADLGNAGCVLRNYELMDPASQEGVAMKPASSGLLRYQSLTLSGLPGSFLSVAVKTRA